jgi:hypothetical protein
VALAVGHALLQEAPAAAGAPWPLLWRLPMWRQAVVPNKGPSGTGLFHLLPYLEQDNLYKADLGWRRLQGAPVKTYVSPADPSLPATGLASGAWGGASSAPNAFVLGTGIGGLCVRVLQEEADLHALSGWLALESGDASLARKELGRALRLASLHPQGKGPPYLRLRSLGAALLGLEMLSSGVGDGEKGTR